MIFLSGGEWFYKINKKSGEVQALGKDLLRLTNDKKGRTYL